MSGKVREWASGWYGIVSYRILSSFTCCRPLHASMHKQKGAEKCVV